MTLGLMISICFLQAPATFYLISFRIAIHWGPAFHDIGDINFLSPEAHFLSAL
jgi:hypothetical protein